MVIIYLAVTLLQQSCCLPFSSVPGTGTLGEQPSSDKYRKADIRGITAHKVYPKLLLPIIPVSSYLTFSPFRLTNLAKKKGSYEVIFCGTFFPM